MSISIERAIQILDPNHREHYEDLPDGMEQIYEACRMGMDALQTLNPSANNLSETMPTNAEKLLERLIAVVQSPVAENGLPTIDGNVWIPLTICIECPYGGSIYMCPREESGNGRSGSMADSDMDCDTCKMLWLLSTD